MPGAEVLLANRIENESDGKISNRIVPREMFSLELEKLIAGRGKNGPVRRMEKLKNNLFPYACDAYKLNYGETNRFL